MISLIKHIKYFTTRKLQNSISLGIYTFELYDINALDGVYARVYLNGEYFMDIVSDFTMFRHDIFITLSHDGILHIFKPSTYLYTHLGYAEKIIMYDNYISITKDLGSIYPYREYIEYGDIMKYKYDLNGCLIDVYYDDIPNDIIYNLPMSDIFSILENNSFNIFGKEYRLPIKYIIHEFIEMIQNR